MKKALFHRPITWMVLCLAAVTALMLPTMLHAKKNALRQDAELVVHTAALGLSGLLKDVETRPAQIEIIKKFVHETRFFEDETGYFFVLDLNGVCIAHGIQHELEGVHLMKAHDANGFYLFKRMVELHATGGGFVEYVWQKPDEPGTHQKLGYVEPIPGTEFIIGTGVYFPKAW